MRGPVGFLAGLLLLLHVAEGGAQQLAIDKGLTFLRTTQNADGSWGGTASSLTTVLQSTAVTARTLQLLGVTDTPLTNALGFLSAQTLTTVDDFAHTLEVLAVSGADVTSRVASLKSAQQNEGGWGLDFEKTFPSAVVDTLPALRALRTAGAADLTTASKALGFLLSIQNPDGGWGAARGQPSEVFYTALALLLLKDFQTTFSLTVPIGAASNLLISRQNVDGSFGSPTGTPFETALALQALVRNTFDSASRSAALAYLTSAQLADGSWGGDAFSTALALRALKDALTIAQAQIQAITLAKVLDGARLPATTYKAFETIAIGVTTATPPPLLEIMVQDSTGAVFSTRFQGGEFFFDTQNLPPGTYTVIVRAIDPTTGIIIDQRTASFTIEATVAVANTVLGVTPRSTHVGATEAVTVVLSLTNRSNVPASLTIEHEIKTPSGTLLNSGVTPLALTLGVASPSVSLVTFSHTFTQSGDYPIQARVLNGTELLVTASDAISAAPAIRIDPSIVLTPKTVPPDGDKRIRIDIRLEGVEQTP